jgi:hypothetical protein
MKTLKTRNCMWCSLGVAFLVLGLVPLTAQATSFTWTGGTSTAWAQTGNWTPAGFPNAYTDTATISASTNNPVSLSGLELLGGTTTVLTIGNTAGTNSLDITSTGTLGVQGGISIGTTRRITVEGILRNDGTAGTHYAIGGASTTGVVLNGGTVSSLSGGVWDFQRPVQGWGAISAPFTNTSTGAVSANVNGQTLHVTGGGTISGALGSTLAGAILSIESAVTAASGTVTIAHTGEVDLNGATLIGLTGGTVSHLSFNNVAGAVKLTGDSTFMGNIDNGSGSGTVIALNAHTLHLNSVTMSNVSGAAALFGVNTGALLDNSVGNSSIPNGAPIGMSGGTVSNTGGGTFTINTQIVGFGAVLGPLTSGNSTKASGGILYVDGTGGAVDVHSTTVFTNGVAGDVADLKGAINFGGLGSLYSNPSGGAGSGEIRLDGATLNGTINSDLVRQGAVNVVNNSSLVGTYNCGAALGINSGKQFTIAGSTLNVGGVGSMTNAGVLAVGNGILNNGTATTYTISGGGSITLAGGSITSTGGGFVSYNTLSGNGKVSALYTNYSKVIADGSGTELTLAMQAITPVTNTGGMGWYARNKGKLTLPTISVSGDNAYNWGGTLMVNSIAMNLAGTTPGDLAIALLSPDRTTDVPAGLSNPIGVWDFELTNGLGIGSADLTFRFDDALAASLSVPETSLNLFHWNGSSWNVVGTTLDSLNHTLTATGVTSFSDYAIAQGSPVPEPGTIALLAIGGIAFGWSRRKRNAA